MNDEQNLRVIATDAGRFIEAFRHVFDTDWYYTKECILTEGMIPAGQTFLRPGLDNCH